MIKVIFFSSDAATYLRLLPTAAGGSSSEMRGESRETVSRGSPDVGLMGGEGDQEVGQNSSPHHFSTLHLTSWYERGERERGQNKNWYIHVGGGRERTGTCRERERLK